MARTNDEILLAVGERPAALIRGVTTLPEGEHKQIEVVARYLAARQLARVARPWVLTLMAPESLANLESLTDLAAMSGPPTTAVQ